MTGVKTKIHNIVLSVTYEGTEFNLNKLVRSLDDARYDPEIFAAIIYKSEDPRASFLIFASGKMNCVGARSMNDAKLAIKKLTRKIRKAHIKVKSAPKVEVQNIVASIDFGRLGSGSSRAQAAPADRRANAVQGGATRAPAGGGDRGGGGEGRPRAFRTRQS
jgi:TATA-box binding protein (TBP) (component of TFIID and TFIIIB)